MSQKNAKKSLCRCQTNIRITVLCVLQAVTWTLRQNADNTHVLCPYIRIAMARQNYNLPRFSSDLDIQKYSDMTSALKRATRTPKST
jgi:hypothetical protein